MAVHKLTTKLQFNATHCECGESTPEALIQQPITVVSQVIVKITGITFKKRGIKSTPNPRFKYYSKSLCLIELARHNETYRVVMCKIAFCKPTHLALQAD
jgi:hypothetical protein